jgi:polyisoprenoid-binding protein YceI
MQSEIKWAIDPVHSEIAFSIRHLMIAHVKGSFKIFDANIYTLGRDFATAQIDFWIDASSIQTGDVNRDAHLIGPDFLDAKKFKQLTFLSTTREKNNETGLRTLWGDLTIRGISKPLQLNVEFGGILIDPWGKERAGFTITGKINRSDWELNWNAGLEAGGVLVGNEISITCELELINASIPAPQVVLKEEGSAATTF